MNRYRDEILTTFHVKGLKFGSESRAAFPEILTITKDDVVEWGRWAGEQTDVVYVNKPIFVHVFYNANIPQKLTFDGIRGASASIVLDDVNAFFKEVYQLPSYDDTIGVPTLSATSSELFDVLVSGAFVEVVPYEAKNLLKKRFDEETFVPQDSPYHDFKIMSPAVDVPAFCDWLVKKYPVRIS